MNTRILTADEVQDKVDDWFLYYGPGWIADAAADSNKSIRKVMELLDLEREYMNFEDAALDKYGISVNLEGQYYVIC